MFDAKNDKSGQTRLPVDERMKMTTGGENRSEEWYLRPDDIRDLHREMLLNADHRRMRFADAFVRA